MPGFYTGYWHIIHLCDFTISKLMEMCIRDSHNTAQGVDEMMQLGKQNAIRVIPAIECDTLFDGLEVHVLGLSLIHI